MTSSLFMPATFVSLSAVAIWAYVRFPKLRPGSFALAIVHVGASFAAFSFSPILIHQANASFSGSVGVVLDFGGIVIPLLSYVLLSWVWLIARIVQLGTGGPRGGKLVDARS